MSRKGKSLPVKYGVTVLVGGLLAVAIMWTNDLTAASSALERVRILSDAFTVPGLLLLFSAGLVAVANNGAFDGIGYALKWTIQRLIPGRAAIETQESYGDYVERKRQDGRVKGYSFLAITGGAFLAVGIGFTIAFYAITK